MSRPIYEHRQFGKLWPLAPVYVIANMVVLSVAGKDMAVVGFISTIGATVLLVIVVLAFSRLTVTVEHEEVRIAFGLGWPRKRFARAEIVSHQPVRNSWLNGWGIRWIKGGSMWNVWGLDAVELELTTGKKFRIGTDEPKRLGAALDE